MAAGHARPRWQLLRTPLAIALVFLLGVLVLLYPTMSSWFAQYQQSQQVVGYAQDVQDLGVEGRQAALAAARRYNEALTGGAVVNAFTRLPVADDHQRPFVYDSLLAADDNGLMARVRIPTIDVDLPVFHGTSEQVLLEGIGHLQGTALPVGGPGTHSVLTGHRGLAAATILTHLDEVELADRFTIETFGEVLTYEVIATAVVEPDETHALRPQPGQDLLTLVTCTPIGVNSHRILVTAERIIPTPVEDVDTAGEPPHVPRFPWWVLAVGGTVITLSAYVWSSGRGATTPEP
ncbi:sortase A [Georgenia satyanarayanai]|uniref:Sortase A n=1 Tax=Georgenia satyanarayanai TaxID=860221 RepID=A0A2Y9API3_9MICO|nr:class C sortase [Georgenia satyanarayanai]PYF96795.1 sortase A [Georgenia satyanarayanai]SSA46391.1 sortase A [Georgenia satyanarayanai]